MVRGVGGREGGVGGREARHSTRGTSGEERVVSVELDVLYARERTHARVGHTHSTGLHTEMVSPKRTKARAVADFD